MNFGMIGKDSTKELEEITINKFLLRSYLINKEKK